MFWPARVPINCPNWDGKKGLPLMLLLRSTFAVIGPREVPAAVTVCPLWRKRRHKLDPKCKFGFPLTSLNFPWIMSHGASGNKHQFPFISCSRKKEGNSKNKVFPPRNSFSWEIGAFVLPDFGPLELQPTDEVVFLTNEEKKPNVQMSW